MALIRRHKTNMKYGNGNKTEYEKVNVFRPGFMGFAHHKYITNNSRNDSSVIYAVRPKAFSNTCEDSVFCSLLFYILRKQTSNIHHTIHIKTNVKLYVSETTGRIVKQRKYEQIDRGKYKENRKCAAHISRGPSISHIFIFFFVSLSFSPFSFIVVFIEFLCH